MRGHAGQAPTTVCRRRLQIDVRPEEVNDFVEHKGCLFSTTPREIPQSPPAAPIGPLITAWLRFTQCDSRDSYVVGVSPNTQVCHGVI